MCNNTKDHSQLSSIENERKSLSLAWDCVLLGTNSYYLSGPITTGLRFIEWFNNTGNTLICKDEYKRAHQSHVIDPNIHDLRVAAIELRENRHLPVIEPGSLHMPSWAQSDYLTFWRSVIQRYVKRVILTGGWEYSFGCINEVKMAMTLNLPIEDLDGNDLDYESCLLKINDAINDLRSKNIPFHEGLILAINDQRTSK